MQNKQPDTMADAFLKKIDAFIAERDLLNRSALTIVALSGGPDSVCLLRVLLALGFRIEAAHCNFGLRGSESDRDEQFCEALCKRLGVKLHTMRFDTRDYAKRRAISIEMAAREQRYAWFEQLLSTTAADAVAVAHHRDDNAETLLLNLLRGTGIDGLKGIAPRNNRIVRPLLAVSRSEILAHLAAIGQDYITDSTNLRDDVQRNFLRLRIMPLLTRLNPAAAANIAATAAHVVDCLPLLSRAVNEAASRIVEFNDNRTVISIKKLLAEVAPETILWHMLKTRGFTPKQTAQIFRNVNAQTGKQWRSATHTLVVNRGKLLVAPVAESPIATSVPGEGTFNFGAWQFTFKIVPIDENFEVKKEPDCASLDAAKIPFPLIIRAPRQGDEFIPFGMRGRKKLSDFFAEKGIPLVERPQQSIIADDNGRIAWVAGLRTDNRFRISKNTKQTLVITRRRR
ncbi:MAG: tRNA lysidine(34) synthetase TilS [Prevotella sp.]|nr:tRNA lysidine(34) synthetase TilS [Prevotella sp.]